MCAPSACLSNILSKMLLHAFDEQAFRWVSLQNVQDDIDGADDCAVRKSTYKMNNDSSGPAVGDV